MTDNAHIRNVTIRRQNRAQIDARRRPIQDTGTVGAHDTTENLLDSIVNRRGIGTRIGVQKGL